MVTAFFTVQPQQGDVYGTEFTVTNLTQGNIYRYVWDLGEGELVYDTKEPTFTYETNGVKTISLTAVDINGNTGTHTTTVSTDYAFRDYLIFTQIPEQFADPGQTTETPFKIRVVSSQINQSLNVDLFATNSKSIPFEFVSPRWSFLNPTWRFLDKNKKIVTTLPVLSAPIYNSDNRLVAISGEAEFYYVDSISNGDTSQTLPILITATLQTTGFNYKPDSNIYKYPSYSNNETVRSGILWHVNDLTPNLLKVTSNYLDPIPLQKWSGIKIPFIVSCHGNKSYRLTGGKDSTSEIIFTYPQNNEVGRIEDVQISLSGVNPNDYTIDEAPLYFQTTDSRGFQTGGYIFTTLTCKTTATNTKIIAKTTAYNQLNANEQEFIYPLGFAPTPFAWISNPGHKTLNKVTVVPSVSTTNTIDYLIDRGALVDGFIKEIKVPSLISSSTYNYTVSGISGVFGLAIDPRNNELIGADAELDRLYKFSSEGVILCAVCLSSISGLDPIENAHTPSNITIDKDSNIWVSLFNSVSVLKFDPDLNFIFSTAPAGFELDEVFEGDFVFKPPYVETDKDNNCWATYASPLCCLLVKYNSTGDILAQIELERFGMPGCMAVDAQNNVWVAKSYNVTDVPGRIDLYDGKTYNRIKTIENVYRPTYLSLDRQNNLWFLFGDRRLGYFNTKTNTLTTWSISTSDSVDNPFLPETFLSKEEKRKDPTLTGLAVDVFNRVWILDSLNSNIWLLSASPSFQEQKIKKIKALPNAPIGYYVDTINFSTYTLPSSQQILQATGDWTGNRWFQKYVTYQTVSSTPVSGESNTFNIEPFVNNYQVARINSTFDMAGYLKSLALPENLANNNVFFNEFLGAVIGNNKTSSFQDIGKTVYEKTANFTDYHGDIDTCGVDQLLSYAELTKTPFINYGAELPVDIKDFLDIASIPRERLWGIPDEIPQLLQSTDIENPLDPQTAILTAGTKLSLRNKFDGRFTVIQVPPMSTTLIYPLSEFLGYGLEQPVTIKYEIYNFIPKYTGEYIENIVDWNNSQTTLSRNLSTFKDWFGDNGAIENNFNYILTKNIFS